MTERSVHCSKCQEELPISAFRSKRITQNTKIDRCNKCLSKAARAWNLAHPDRYQKTKERHNAGVLKLETSKRYRNENRDHLDFTAVKWRNENPEKWKVICKRTRDKNIEKIIVRNKARAIAVFSAIPKWADQNKILEIYKRARKITRETGIIHHVDHIIPLRGKYVCGLHIETNLQILPARENIRKGNRYPLGGEHFESILQ